MQLIDRHCCPLEDSESAAPFPHVVLHLEVSSASDLNFRIKADCSSTKGLAVAIWVRQVHTVPVDLLVGGTIPEHLKGIPQASSWTEPSCMIIGLSIYTIIFVTVDNDCTAGHDFAGARRGT